jgi:MarR family transcriptional regulator, organic hydroperoxide resistance regulator
VTPRALDSSYDAAEASPGLLLWRATNRWQAGIRAILAPWDLTHVQFVLLASLTWLVDEGPVTQKRLAEHAATDPMMTSQVLRTLETKGFVVRAAHPDDGRARALSVTAQGLRVANESVVAVEAWDRSFFGPLGSGSARFVADLARLSD